VKITIATDEQCAETEITVRCSRFSDDIERIVTAIRMLDARLTGHRDGRRHVIEAADVMYVDSADRRTFLYATSGVYETPMKLYELEARLADMDFMRAGKNCLFNINHVRSIEPDFDRRLILTMEKGIRLVVSRQYSAAVKRKLEAYDG